MGGVNPWSLADLKKGINCKGSLRQGIVQAGPGAQAGGLVYKGVSESPRRAESQDSFPHLSCLALIPSHIKARSSERSSQTPLLSGIRIPSV